MVVVVLILVFLLVLAKPDGPVARLVLAYPGFV
jgi:hypothetical protein